MGPNGQVADNEILRLKPIFRKCFCVNKSKTAQASKERKLAFLAHSSAEGLRGAASKTAKPIQPLFLRAPSS